MTLSGQDADVGSRPRPALRRGDRVIVTVEKLAFDGPGIAFAENGTEPDGSPRRLKISIEGVAPGDQVEVELYSVKHGMGNGRVVRYLRKSPARVVPACPHFGRRISAGVPEDANGNNTSGRAESGNSEVSDFLPDGRLDLSANCGGCTWQFLAYEDQLKEKEQQVRNALLQIAEIPEEELVPVWRPIMAAENPWWYRNKMDFSFVRNREGALHLGLHMRGRYRDVTEIKSCQLFRPWVGELLEVLRPFFEKCELGKSGDRLDERGDFKALLVRAGTNTGEVMVNLQVENAETDWADQFTAVVRKFFEGLPGQTSGKTGAHSDHLVSIFLTKITNKKGQSRKLEEQLLWGAPVFREELRLARRTLKFEVAPQAFLQPNTSQAEKFYSLVIELARLTGKERVFDLFCGTGTIGMCLAEKAGQVTGLELNAPAVENARQNAAQNKVKNIDFIVGDTAKLLPEIGTAVSAAGKTPVDLIVVDPPRAGLTPKIIETIAATAARRMIYVSCNPHSLARDLKLLIAKGFRLSFVQAIDQFSQTYHVETVVLLER
jgi:23S rRNA (uracil1939-C5)-methyltransferase